ncbi:MAG: hypothetical protein CL678_06385 [Bdellovibrionaceae bacterium]|nr:hypothetical protein [Pseudobdellovibrionaceae bacterium]|tara:strand:- start:2114 stop:2353 length:240 start_codon:yes stop_codon:yes gene_type:complete
MLKCKDLTKRINSLEPLHGVEKISVFFHLAICKSCRTYTKHLKLISQYAKKFFEGISVSEETVKKIEDESIDEIKKKIS